MKCAVLVIALLLSCWHVAGWERSRDAASAPSGNDAAASDANWAQFTDGAERAFTVQVPQGWNVVGGVYRFGRLDPRVMVDMESPDGKTDLRLSDANVPPFATLNQQFLKLGWHEGRPYNLKDLAREVVANYRAGWVFADLYGQARFSPVCSQLHLKQMRKVPNIHEEPKMQTTAGDVLYTCDSTKGPMAAYVFAETQLYQTKVAGTWVVSWLYSFIAPEDQAMQAMHTILHSICSFEISGEWDRRQRRAAGDTEDWGLHHEDEDKARTRSRIQEQCTQFTSQVDAFSKALRGVDVATNIIDSKPREVWRGPGGTRWINPVSDAIVPPVPPASSSPSRQTEP